MKTVLIRVEVPDGWPMPSKGVLSSEYAGYPFTEITLPDQFDIREQAIQILNKGLIHDKIITQSAFEKGANWLLSKITG